MNKKILVVEDEKQTRKLLAGRLKREDWDILEAGDGEEGLKVVGKEKIDLILLDIYMPKVDGLTVLETLNKGGNKTPVLVLSNHSEREKIQRAMELGSYGYLIKMDVSMDEIIEKVKNILEDNQ